MEELRPCPFCGSDHVDLICMGTREDDPHVVECDDCDATATGMDRAEAVANWNRRAGRTCRDFGGEEGTNGEGYDFACPVCGWCGDVTEPNFCPHCGAWVEG